VSRFAWWSFDAATEATEGRADHVRDRVGGRPFMNRPNALVCGEECRRQRKLDLRKRLREVA
jgi:hypothetical protein